MTLQQSFLGLSCGLAFLTLTADPAAVLPSSASAQDATQAQEKLLVLSKGPHGIDELIKKSGEFLGRNYLFDSSQSPEVCNPNNPQGKIELPRELRLDAASCEEVIGQILFAHNWVAAVLDPEQKLYDWVFLPGPKGPALKQQVRQRSPEEVLAQPKRVEFVAVAVKLEHLNAQLAAANLRQFFNDPRGLLNLLPTGGQRSGSLLVTGFQPQVAQILDLLKMLDVATPAIEQGLTQRLAAIEARLRRLEKQRK